MFAGDGVDNNGGVFVESDVSSVWTAGFFAGADNNSLDNLLVILTAPFLSPSFDSGGDNVANVTKALARTAVDENNFDLFGAGVVGDLEN